MLASCVVDECATAADSFAEVILSRLCLERVDEGLVHIFFGHCVRLAFFGRC
jgi:hypothetical protein